MINHGENVRMPLSQCGSSMLNGFGGKLVQLWSGAQMSKINDAKVGGPLWFPMQRHSKHRLLLIYLFGFCQWRDKINSHPTVWNGFVQLWDKTENAGVKPAGKRTTYLCHFLPPAAVFTHLMCNQLDVWALGITCHTDRPNTAGNRPLAWYFPLETRGHTDFTWRSPCTPPSQVQFHQELWRSWVKV